MPSSEPLQRAALALNAKRPEEAQRIAEEILRRDPRHARALHILGFALLMQGRAEAAVAPLEAAARGRHDPEIETRLALALSQIGRRDDALSRLKRASKRQPPYAPAFHGLGTLLFAMERYDEAIEALRRGVAVAPMMPEMTIQLGNVHLQRRNYGEAKSRLWSGASDFAGLARRAVGMGKAHYAIGHSEAAADCFRRCLRIRPDDDSAMASSRTLSTTARRARGGLRVFSYRVARRSEALWQGAFVARCIGPRPNLVEAERGGAIYARSKEINSSASAPGIADDKRRFRGQWRSGSRSSGRRPPRSAPRSARPSSRVSPAGIAPPACLSAARR